MDVHCVATDDVKFECAISKARYSLIWFFNGTEVTEAFVKENKNRITTTSTDGGLTRTLLVTDACLEDNCQLYAVCEGVAQTRVAEFNVVPIIFEVPPTDAVVCAKETATFVGTTNKQGVKVIETSLILKATSLCE